MGLPRPARRDRGGEGARGVRPRSDHRVRNRPVQRLLPHLGPALHPGMGALRHPPGPLGGLRATTTRRWTSPTWRASCGPSSGSGRRASSTRTTGFSPTAGSARRHSPTPRPARTTPTGTARIRPSPWPSPWSPQRQAPEAVAGAVQVWVWTTTPWTLPSNLALAVGPEVTYAVFERDGARFLLGDDTVAAYEKQLEGASVVGSVTGRDLVGRRYRPLFPYFESVRQRLRGAVGGLRDHRRGDRGGAPGARVRGRRPDRLRRGGHTGRLPGRRPHPLHFRGPRFRGSAGVRSQPADHQGSAPSGNARPVRLLRARLPPLLANRHAPRLPGRHFMVRKSDSDQGPAARMQSGDHLDT